MPPKRSGSSRKQLPRGSYRVFVSHATADKWVARTICEKIEESTGATTFRDDRDIGGGQPIPAVIRAEIREADELLVLLTPTSLTRIWVGMEIGMAFMLEKPIVPIWYNVPVSSLAFLANNKGYSLDDVADYLTALGARVRRKRQ